MRACGPGGITEGNDGPVSRLADATEPCSSLYSLDALSDRW